MSTVETITENPLSAHHDFDVTDRLGRKIGLQIDLMNEKGRWGHGDRPGVFSFVAQVTRNGQRHQASHMSADFASAAERDQAVTKAVTAARKRAQAPAARLKA
jgi:hypothetical protein